MAPCVLIVRHPQFQARFYDVVLEWAREHAPQCLPWLDVRDLPCHVTEWWAVRLLVPWLQDPVQAWSPGTFAFMEQLTAQCDARAIPVINRVGRLANAGKAAAAETLRATGLRTPRTVRIADAAAFRRDVEIHAYPLFVREDWGHGGVMARADTPREAASIPLEQFARPVATEIIDVRDPGDGLHYKYRYLACGAIGVSQHVQASVDWITRGSNRVANDATRARELAYIARQDPHHERFQAARKALGLEFVAFDYGYTPEGEVVVWEVNPFPHVQFGRTSTVYRNHAIHRSVAAMLKLYLDTARLETPAAIEAALRY